ncbi:MAG TPA: hypothetical protein VIY48_08080 [Candidatus Paceibacterota bacterium]
MADEQEVIPSAPVEAFFAAVERSPHTALSYIEEELAKAETIPADFLGRLRDLVTLVKTKR